MKRITSWFPCIAAIGTLFMMVGLTSCESTQQATGSSSNMSGEEVVKAVNDDRWVFVANTAQPQRGRTRMLTGGYEVNVKGDTLVSYLPYMGRAYSADYGSTTSVLDFTSTNFGYTKQKDSKGTWNITIKPADYTQVQSMFFNIYENGSAMLSVQFTNREPINFNGSVMKK